MKLLSGILGLTLTSVVALASANAADMYRAPEGVGGYKDAPYVALNWSGFYAGVNGGYAWSERSDQLANTSAPFSGLGPEGGFGGGQIGYNWQGIWHPHLVLGIEADIQGAGIEASGTDGIGDTYRSKLDWFGTVRGRLGYALDRTLVYFTGGFAYGGVKNEAIDSGSGDRFVSDKTATGYTLGGGLEYLVAPGWSVKAEYQYIDLGKNDPTYSGVPYTSVAEGAVLHDDAFHTVRAGINYHFGSDYVPLK